MGPQPAPVAKSVFGPFEFEASSGDLRKFGNRIRLQGKPLQILTLLLERPGEIISREELQKHLWQGTTFVDFEQGLNSAVNKLRQALSDSPDQPRYVETLPGKGYRFVAPIQNPSNRTIFELAPPPAAVPDAVPEAVPAKVPATVPTTVPTTVPASPISAPARSWVPWLLAITLCASISFWLGSRQIKKSPPAPALRFEIRPPAGFVLEGAATRQAFALSPNGTRLAFSATDGSGASQLFLRDLQSLDTHPIPNTRGVHTMFWHPNSDALYISIGRAIRRVSLDGKGFVAISDAPAFTFSGLLLNPTTLLLDSSSTSYSVSANGGTLLPLKNLMHWPQALPGSNDLLYTCWDPEAKRYRAVIGPYDQSGIARLSFLSDSRVLHTPSILTPGASFLLYVSGGNLVAHPFDVPSRQLRGDALPLINQVNTFHPVGSASFSVSSNGLLAYQTYAARSQLNWVDRSGKRLSAIGPANVNLQSARLSPDGTQIATSIYDIEKGAQNLWLIDSQSGAAKQVTSAFGLRDAPVWAPQGGKLAFLYAAGGGQPKIGIRGSGENDSEAVETEGGFQLPTDWSPDGRFIVYSDNGYVRMASEAQGDIMLMDLQRGRRRIPLLHSPFHESGAVFSPDGKWLAFTSNESGRNELYLQAFAGGDQPGVSGERFAVSRSGALVVRWRRDGRELYYLGFDGKVYAVPVRLAARPAFGEAKALFTISMEARAAIHAIAGFDVSPDGQRFVIPALNEGEGPSIVILQNWEASLPARPNP